MLQLKNKHQELEIKSLVSLALELCSFTAKVCSLEPKCRQSTRISRELSKTFVRTKQNVVVETINLLIEKHLRQGGAQK